MPATQKPAAADAAATSTAPAAPDGGASEGPASTGNGSAGPSSLASSPEFAMASLYQSYAHSMGLLYQNAVEAQQQLSTVGQAATVLGLLRLMAVNAGAKPAAPGAGPAGGGSAATPAA